MTQVRKVTQIYDFLGHEVRDFLFWLVAGDPSSPVEGLPWYDTVAHRLKIRTNSATKTLAHLDEIVSPTFGTPTNSAVGDSAAQGAGSTFATNTHVHGREAFGAVTAQTSFGTSSANGTATTETHSDHTHGTPTHDGAAHSAISLSALSAPTAALSHGGFKASNAADGTADTDLATVGQMNASLTGLKWKSPDAVAKTTGNITLSGTQTVDGVSVAAGQRVVVGSQTAGSENGLYLCASGAWTRTTDADTAGELAGAAVTVSGGTANADTAWYVSTDNITLGTTAITWAPFPGAGAITASAPITKTGGAIGFAAASAFGTGGPGGGLTNAGAVDSGLVARYKTFTIGDGAATTFALTHSFSRKIVQVTVSDTTDDSEWDVGVTFTSTSVVTLDFGATVPTSSQFSVLVVG